MKKFFLIFCLLYVFFVAPALANPVVEIAPITMLLPTQFMSKYPLLYVYFIISMFIAGIVETFFLWVFGHKGWKVLTYFFAINLISNYAVNILYHHHYGVNTVLLLEIAAIIFETIALGLLTKYSWKLLWDVTKTNIISFILGIVVLVLFFF